MKRIVFVSVGCARESSRASDDEFFYGKAAFSTADEALGRFSASIFIPNNRFTHSIFFLCRIKLKTDHLLGRAIINPFTIQPEEKFPE